MYDMNSYLRLLNGDKQEFNIKLKTVENDGIYAVYIDGFSNQVLDSEFGAGIEFAIPDMESFTADYRYSELWCKPAFGNEPKEIPGETQGIIYRKKDGNYGVVLPVVSDKYKCVLCGTEDNRVVAKLFSWYDKLVYVKALAFVYAEGDNPFKLMKKCAKYGMKLLNTGSRVREEREYPKIFEYLGWCSWDAFEIRVSEENLVNKCKEFKEKSIPVKWAIIDDMWGDVHDFYDAEYSDRPEMFRLMHHSKLFSFRADSKRFPNGLKGCIDKIKEFNLAVGMWHPTTGYWMGIDPEGEIYKNFKEYLLQTEDGRYIHSFKQDKAYMFYNAFHSYLRKCGADFVKIDNQSITKRYYKGLAPVGEVSREFHGGMEASVGQHFANTMINCMGMASEDMWNRSVSAISRCSNDFQPEDKEWFTKNTLECIFNCLVQGQFYYCDYDMWWTDDAQGIKNSILRAISGGPIYISDKLGRSRRDILMPLIFNDGKILRCDRPAMPTADCITDDPTVSGHIFKIQNICSDSGVIAVFNLDAENRSVSGYISPMDIDGINGEDYVIYEHFSRKHFIVKKDEKIKLSLKNSDEFRLYIVVPIVDGFAAIGRTDKFISPKSIKSVSHKNIELIEDGEYAYIDNGKLEIKNKRNSQLKIKNCMILSLIESIIVTEKL